MKLYKITNGSGYSYNHTLWEEGCSHEVESCDTPELCTGSVLHAYRDVNLGLLINPVHNSYTTRRLWECEGEPVIEDWGKVGTFSFSNTHEIEFPTWYEDNTLCQRVQVLFAILCAEQVLAVYETYTSEDGRPRKAIEAAREYLNNPTAADAAAYAADAAAEIDFVALANQAVNEILLDN